MKLTVSMFFLVLLATSCAGAPSPDTLAPCPGLLRTHTDTQDPSALSGEPERGAALFAGQCARCHSARVIDRSSRLFRGYPRLDCASYHEDVSDGYLRRVIAQGGPAVGLDGAMKPFAVALGEQDITDLIAYLRSQAH